MESIQKVVFSLVVLITHSKFLYLIYRVVHGSPPVRHNLIERLVFHRSNGAFSAIALLTERDGASPE
jgi:hypothetical protein